MFGEGSVNEYIPAIENCYTNVSATHQYDNIWIPRLFQCLFEIVGMLSGNNLSLLEATLTTISENDECCLYKRSFSG